ncbi:hypothetical protein BN1356_00003 [Streptococcus varani]|uniref:Uncharacterized protein n=1 Tax=Streptococcus varani TaxID=1608583 RepID=A0A0E4H2F4_9STRE|nr:hypothetical protein [Streptococcus varani]CQR23631.1 hypothetical protein BN1356_00003 [Streptococcus varani]
MKFICNIDDRYKDLPLTITLVNTTSDNPYLTNNSRAIGVIVKDAPNLLDYIDDGDLLQIEGSAGTNNDYHLAKVRFQGDTAYFSKTSSLIKELPVTEIEIADLNQVGIFSKILFSISKASKDELLFETNMKRYI